jgi:hypothetical protein
VKPVEFTEFMSVIKQLVAFWSTINEPPPNTVRTEISVETAELVLSEGQGMPNSHLIVGE